MAVLTISREFGSGGKEIGRGVAEAKGYEFVDKERILAEVGAKGGRWEQWAKDLDERCPTTWERFDWSFRGFGALIQSTLLDYAVRDDVVLVGRGANFLLQGIPHVLNLRVVAPLEARIARIVQREAVNRQAARWMAEKIDHERACFLYALYGRHAELSRDYDLVIDTGGTSIEEVVRTVRELVDQREGRKTPEAQRLLEMRAAAARVRAGLATDRSLFIPTLDVETDGQNIILRGIVHNPKEHTRIEAVARKLAGSLDLKCELHYRG